MLMELTRIKKRQFPTTITRNEPTSDEVANGHGTQPNDTKTNSYGKKCRINHSQNDETVTSEPLKRTYAEKEIYRKSRLRILHMQLLTSCMLNPFIITFWNDIAPDDVYNLLSSTKERPIIAALNFSVSDYHNVSLSSTSASVVLIKSNIGRVQALQKWLCIHKESVDILQQQGDVFRKAQNNFSHDPEVFSSIETLLTTEQPNRYDLLARGKVSRSNQNFIYPCCAKCHRLTSAAYGRSFECHSCHEIRSAIPRFRFSLLIYDDSGEIEVTVFGDEGEKVMQMSANNFLTQFCNNEPLILDSINSNLRQMKLKMKIQSKVFNKQDGTTTMSHTMQTLECHQLPSTSSPPGLTNELEISVPHKIETTSIPSTTKEHPRPDIHPTTSSRGRASKAKKTE
ncbi:hypothetical protein OROMI_002530 [Orobanche minor]